MMQWSLYEHRLHLIKPISVRRLIQPFDTVEEAQAFVDVNWIKKDRQLQTQPITIRCNQVKYYSIEQIHNLDVAV